MVPRHKLRDLGALGPHAGQLGNTVPQRRPAGFAGRSERHEPARQLAHLARDLGRGRVTEPVLLAALLEVLDREPAEHVAHRALVDRHVLDVAAAGMLGSPLGPLLGGPLERELARGSEAFARRQVPRPAHQAHRDTAGQALAKLEQLAGESTTRLLALSRDRPGRQHLLELLVHGGADVRLGLVEIGRLVRHELRAAPQAGDVRRHLGRHPAAHLLQHRLDLLHGAGCPPVHERHRVRDERDALLLVLLREVGDPPVRVVHDAARGRHLEEVLLVESLLLGLQRLDHVAELLLERVRVELEVGFRGRRRSPQRPLALALHRVEQVGGVGQAERRHQNPWPVDCEPFKASRRSRIRSNITWSGSGCGCGAISL